MSYARIEMYLHQYGDDWYWEVYVDDDEAGSGVTASAPHSLDAAAYCLEPLFKAEGGL